MNITTIPFVKKVSAETRTAETDIQKLVLIMQKTVNVSGRKSVPTNTKKTESSVKIDMLENEVNSLEMI